MAQPRLDTAVINQDVGHCNLGNILALFGFLHQHSEGMRGGYRSTVHRDKNTGEDFVVAS